MSNSISIIIPAYNDEGTIEDVVREAASVAEGLTDRYEVIVINDGSDDATGDILESLEEENLRVIHHNPNEGFGLTMRELYARAREDLVFSAPGDGQIPPRVLGTMMPALEDHDLVVGYRRRRNDPFRRRIQSFVYNSLISILYGVRLKDVNSTKLMRTQILRDISLSSSSAFIEAELCIRAKRAGYRIGEVIVDHLPRTHGEASGSKFHVIWDTLKDTIAMWRTLR